MTAAAGLMDGLTDRWGSRQIQRHAKWRKRKEKKNEILSLRQQEKGDIMFKKKWISDNKIWLIALKVIYLYMFHDLSWSLMCWQLLKQLRTQLVLAVCWRVDFRFLPLHWTGKKAGWGVGGLHSLASLQQSQLKGIGSLSRCLALSHLSMLQLKGRTREQTQRHTHTLSTEKH